MLAASMNPRLKIKGSRLKSIELGAIHKVCNLTESFTPFDCSMLNVARVVRVVVPTYDSASVAVADFVDFPARDIHPLPIAVDCVNRERIYNLESNRFH